MARLNASNPPVVASNQIQNEEEIVEEGNWGQSVFTEQWIANSVITEDQGETQLSFQIREQLDAEQRPEQDSEQDPEEEDEDVSENVLHVLNNVTSTPRTSNRDLEENEPRQAPPLSVRKRISGLFGGILGTGSRANDNDITEDTNPTEATGDAMQLPPTKTSTSKPQKKLTRPKVLHQPLNTLKKLQPQLQPQPQSSGKADVYEVNASPGKAASTSTRTQSKQAQGVKRKRNDPPPSKRPSPRGNAPSPNMTIAASKKLEGLQSDVPARATRSRGSGEIIEPIDYSRKVEDTGKRKRSSGPVDGEPPSKKSRKRSEKDVEDGDNELEDENSPSTPSDQNRAEEGIQAEEATPGAWDKGSRSGAASRPSDAAARRTRKGKNASVEDKEDPEDQDFQDDGNGGEESEGEEESESVAEGVSPTDAANPNRKHQSKRQVYTKSPLFGDDFIAESNIEEITKFIDKLGMTQGKELQNNPESLETADTVPGQEIQVLTRSIISSYESIQGLDEHEDPDPAARTEALCSAARDLDRLEVTVGGIMEKDLCNPAKLAAGNQKKRVEWRREMLKDLFLFVMPDIIRAASAAILTYGSEGPPSTPDLKEILRYITLVSRLLLIVEDQHNKDHRPKNASPPILRPYASIKPLLRGFENQCKQELRHREEVAEGKRKAPILEKKRIEREEAHRLAAEEAQMEYQRRQEAVNDEYNRERMKLGLAPVTLEGTQISQNLQPSEPPQPSQFQQTEELNITAHRIRAEREVSALAKEVDALTKKLEAAERNATKLRREEQRQLQGYDAEETQEVDYERVEMFPAGNNHAPPAEPWTKTEYEVLADGLRLETGMSRLLPCYLFSPTNLRIGPDKYPNIARSLDRSLDEIFEKAMEFKRVMIEGLYMKHGVPVEPWIEIIGNEMLPRGRE